MAQGAQAIVTAASAPLKPVYFTTVAASAIGATYGLIGIPPSPFPLLFITAAPVVAVASWVQRDAHLRHWAAIQDFGLFTYLLFFVVVPWYVVRTRGKQGWTLALLLLAAIAAPYVLTVAGALWHDALWAAYRRLANVQ